MIKILGLRALSDRLARLDINPVQQAALETVARKMQEAIQETLSVPPGSDHEAPWLRTGTLQESIGHQSDNSAAVIGSNNPVAVDQELGTDNIPPRPFLSPTAAALAPGIALEVGGSIAAAIRVATKDAMS